MTQRVFHEGSVIQALFRLALPLFFLNLVNSLYNVVDTFWVGQLGELQVGAVSLVGPVLWCAQSLASGLSAAAVALIGTRLGENKLQEASRFATTLLYVAGFLGVALSVFTLLGAQGILHLIATPAELFNDSRLYLFGIAFDYVGLLILNVYMAICQSEGNSRLGVKVNILASIANLILDPLFIFIFHMDVFGAAVATVVSKWLVIPLIVYQLLHTKRAVRIRFHSFRFHKEDLKLIFRVCIPASGGQFLESLGFVLLNTYIVSYGAVAMSAYGVGNKIINLSGIPLASFSAASSTIVAHGLGSNQPERCKECYRKTWLLAESFTAALGVLTILFAQPLICLFVPDAGKALVSYAREFVIYAAVSSIFMCWYSVLCGVFNGAGHTKYTFILGILRLWIFRIPLILLFQHVTNWGITGIWIAMILSNIMECIAAQWMYIRGGWLNSTILSTETDSDKQLQ